MSSGVPYKGYTYLNLFDTSELIEALEPSTVVLKPLLLTFLSRATVIINYVR